MDNQRNEFKEDKDIVHKQYTTRQVVQDEDDKGNEIYNRKQMPLIDDGSRKEIYNRQQIPQEPVDDTEDSDEDNLSSDDDFLADGKLLICSSININRQRFDIKKYQTYT